MPLLIGSLTVNLNDGEIKMLRTLFDGGSTRSFLSPFLAEDFSCWARDGNVEKDFIIKGAISTTQKVCKVLNLRINIGGWSSVHPFVISDYVTRYDAVIGRNMVW